MHDVQHYSVVSCRIQIKQILQYISNIQFDTQGTVILAEHPCMTRKAVPLVGRTSDTLPKNAPICRAW